MRLVTRVWQSPTATTWGSFAVRLGGVLVILPMVLVRFAPSEIALWQLFSSLYALMLLFDFGLAPTLSRMLAFAQAGTALADMVDMRRPRAHAAGATSDASATDTTSRIFSTQRWLAHRMALVLSLLLLAGGSFALLRPIEQVPSVWHGWAAWLVVVCGSAAGFIGNAHAAALQGLGNIAAFRRWEMASGMAQIATSALLVAAGGDLLGLVLTFQAWIIFGAWRNRRLMRALHPVLFEQPALRDPEVLRVMWPATWRSGVGVLASQGVIQLSGIVYSQVAPAEQVASYLLGLRVMTVISQFSQAPFYSKLPLLATLHAVGDRAAMLTQARRGMRRSHAVFVGGALTAAVATPYLLAQIGSKAPFVGPAVWALLAVGFFLERLGAMHLQLYSLTNHIVWHVANGVAGAVMLLGAVLLYPLGGQPMLPMALLLGNALWYVPYSMLRTRSAFDLRLGRFELTASVPSLALLAAGLAWSVYAGISAPS